MKTIAIVLNPEKPEAIELVKTLVPHLRERGIGVVIEHNAARATGFPQLSRDLKELASADFALVLGGDGTLLRASARQYALRASTQCFALPSCAQFK